MPSGGYLGVHAVGEVGLSGGELGSASADTAAGAGGFQALPGALADQVGEHLVHSGEHVEGEPPGRGGGVDALFEHHQVDPALVQVRGDAVR